jgi:hypothetical protein
MFHRNPVGLKYVCRLVSVSKESKTQHSWQSWPRIAILSGPAASIKLNQAEWVVKKMTPPPHGGRKRQVGLIRIMKIVYRLLHEAIFILFLLFVFSARTGENKIPIQQNLKSTYLPISSRHGYHRRWRRRDTVGVRSRLRV